MKIRDALDQAGRELAVSEGPLLYRSRLVQRAAELCGKKPGSILPSDYCHNRGNNGRKCSPPENGAFLMWVEEGVYRYVGPSYVHEGEIIRKPKS